MSGKMRMCRAFALAIVIVLFSLAGCGQNGGKVALVDKPAPETVVRMFASKGTPTTFNQAKYWSENFKKQTGFDAVIHYDEESQYYAKAGQDERAILRRRIESKQPDDMYIVYAEDMVEFARKGYLLDMSEFDFVDNLSEPARQLSTIDGKVYCLPLSYTGFGLYWNVDLLRQHGLTVPKNYGELLAVWDALVARGITPYAGNKGYALTVPAMCLGFAEVYQSEEKDRLLKALADGTTPASVYARKGFAFIALMRDKGYINAQEAVQTAPLGPKEIARFRNGEAACVCSTMSTLYYCDVQKTGFEVKMTGWPLLENGCISVVGTDQKLCINPKSKHLNIVTAFVEMAGSAKALMQCTENEKVSSGRENDPSKYRPSEREFDELIQTDGQIPNMDMNLKLNLWEYIRDISRMILTGEITVDEACQRLDALQERDAAANAAASQ